MQVGWDKFYTFVIEQRQESLHANTGDSIDPIDVMAETHTATVQEELDERSPLLKSEERGMIFSIFLFP